MGILPTLRAKTLLRVMVFAGLCLLVAGAAAVVWILCIIDPDVATPAITYTRESGGQIIASSPATGSSLNTVGSKNSVGELDPATQAHIREIVAAADAEKSYQVKTLDNDYFVAHNEVTDGGQELTGYFKNGQIQKIDYSIGLSFGLNRYLYYFDGGELVYVSAEEDDYPATNEGLDYEKTELAFSAEYFFLNGKLLGTNSKGTGRYLSVSTANADDALMARADELRKLLQPDFSTAESVYTNNDFGFQLSYPSTWVKKDNKFEWRGDLNKDMILAVDFVDPVRERDMAINDCLANRCTGWVNSSPTKADCEPLIASLEPGHENDCGSREDPRDIFIRIYKSDLPLKQWLLVHNKIPHSELENYQVGKATQLSGVQGYFSSTGCCGGVDQAHVVKKGNYIYEVGSQDGDSLFLEAYVNGFKFTQ
jgi:hypothetical protein